MLLNRGYYTVGAKIWILSLSCENNILRLSKILFSPREDEIHTVSSSHRGIYFLLYSFNAKSGK